MILREVLQTATKRLGNRLDAEILLAHVLKKPKEFLLSHDDETISQKKIKYYQKIVEERRLGKPVAYLIREKEFYCRKFYVDPRVLIPRPETEEMVEYAIQYLTKNKKPKTRNQKLETIVDLGTGSGNIAITVALELPDRKVIGLDISKAAIAVAKKNAKILKSKNVKFLHSDLLQNLPATSNQKPVTIIANLPYIGTSTNRYVSKETLTYEPELAIFGGEDGLDLYRRTFAQIKKMNLNIAAMFMEIGWSQADEITKEAKQVFPSCHVEIKNDLAGLPRIAIISLY